VIDSGENILTFDPGKTVVGWAYFRSRRLDDCGLFYTQDWAISMNWLRVALPFSRVLIESQQIYAQRLQKGRQSDLIDVAHVAGAIFGVFGGRSPIDFVLPHTWKGNVPKKIMLERISKKLEAQEKAIFDSKIVPRKLRHNILDAIGIGLWKSGRLR
jgi:hypothetical protein